MKNEMKIRCVNNNNNNKRIKITTRKSFIIIVVVVFQNMLKAVTHVYQKDHIMMFFFSSSLTSIPVSVMLNFISLDFFQMKKNEIHFFFCFFHSNYSAKTDLFINK